MGGEKKMGGERQLTRGEEEGLGEGEMEGQKSKGEQRCR